MSHQPPDPYMAHDAHLRHVHQALLAKLRELGEALPATAQLAERVTFACKAMLFHHHAESAGLFPRLRRAGRLRSADVAFLDACERDHAALHGLSQRLLAEGEAPHLRPRDIAAIATDLAAQFAMHIADEEAGLAPPRLRTMITPEELEAIARDAEALRPR